jgi:hypothetical protein
MSLLQVVCALANGKPIVTPLYWDKYIAALSTKQPFPDCKDYVPPLAETTLNVNEVLFDVNENRKKLFVGKHFVFSSAHQYNLFSCMVTAAGNAFTSSVIIQGVSRLYVITAGGDFLSLCDEKSSYKHVSDFGRLMSYGHFLIPVHALV